MINNATNYLKIALRACILLCMINYIHECLEPHVPLVMLSLVMRD